jgi:hypothetical protein
MPAAQLHLQVGGCSPGELSQSSRDKLVSAQRARLRAASFTDPGGSSSAAERRRAAISASPSSCDSLNLRRWLTARSVPEEAGAQAAFSSPITATDRAVTSERRYLWKLPSAHSCTQAAGSGSRWRHFLLQHVHGSGRSHQASRPASAGNKVKACRLTLRQGELS